MTPEAVAQAMKVLEIHERLEHPDNSADTNELVDRLGSNEVEVLKEMCNVSVQHNLLRIFLFTNTWTDVPSLIF